jgi:hypothetical protein
MQKTVFIFITAFILLFAIIAFGQDGANSGIEFPNSISTIIGLVIFPLVAQLVTKYDFSPELKFWITIGLAIVTGIGASMIMGISPTDTVQFAGYVWVLSQIAYKSWWKRLFLSETMIRKLPIFAQRTK